MPNEAAVSPASAVCLYTDSWQQSTVTLREGQEKSKVRAHNDSGVTARRRFMVSGWRVNLDETELHCAYDGIVSRVQNRTARPSEHSIRH